jgi:hypothetical protein
MKKAILIFAIIASMASLAFADPRLSIPEKSWDFGYVPQHGTFTHDYWIKNVGTDTLKIIKVKPG